MSDFTISEVAIPAFVDAPDAGDFLGAVDLRNAVARHSSGNDDSVYPAEEILPNWQNQKFRPMRMFVAKIDSRVVARSIYDMTAGIDAPEVVVVIEVSPDFRRQGIGSALLDAFVQQARREGRRALQTWFLMPARESAEWLEASTGFGRVPADYPGVAFANSRGFTLEQVARTSALTLPLDETALAETLEATRAVAGTDYTVISWTPPTPDDRIDDLAELRSRMSTDAPSGGLEVTEQHWDADRVRANERIAEAGGQVSLLTAAVHVPTGRLVAFTELQASHDVAEPVGQADTLVLREHRGHRLGLLVKAENLAYMQRTHPGHPKILTNNAEENRPMLDVNDLLGFRAVGYAPAWSLAL